MALPLLKYSPISQNQRVAGYEVAGEEQLSVSAETMFTEEDVQAVIWAAYRQIFGEHQILDSYRQKFLESQLRDGQLTVKDFVRGLLNSESFRRNNYETNNNYRFVEICVQRVLGRDVYGEDEKIAWSIVVASKGVQGFTEALLSSDEYTENFGEDKVPFQQRRVLPYRDGGETPFNLKTPRYDSYHRQQLGFPQVLWQNQVSRFKPQEGEKAKAAGNPNLYMDLARGINSAKVNPAPRVPVQSVSLASVPYRKTT